MLSTGDSRTKAQNAVHYCDWNDSETMLSAGCLKSLQMVHFSCWKAACGCSSDAVCVPCTQILVSVCAVSLSGVNYLNVEAYACPYMCMWVYVVCMSEGEWKRQITMNWASGRSSCSVFSGCSPSDQSSSHCVCVCTLVSDIVSL